MKPLLLFKAVRVKYSECVFVHFVTQHAKCMRRIIFSSVSRLPLPYFSTLFNIPNGYGKELNTEYAS
jgi:hypothetical protein